MGCQPFNFSLLVKALQLIVLPYEMTPLFHYIMYVEALFPNHSSSVFNPLWKLWNENLDIRLTKHVPQK